MKLEKKQKVVPTSGPARTNISLREWVNGTTDTAAFFRTHGFLYVLLIFEYNERVALGTDQGICLEFNIKDVVPYEMKQRKVEI